MYQKAGGAVAAGGAAALPFTGGPSIWTFIAAFTLLVAGFSLLRLVPKREA